MLGVVLPTQNHTHYHTHSHTPMSTSSHELSIVERVSDYCRIPLVQMEEARQDPLSNPLRFGVAGQGSTGTATLFSYPPSHITTLVHNLTLSTTIAACTRLLVKT